MIRIRTLLHTLGLGLVVSALAHYVRNRHDMTRLFGVWPPLLTALLVLAVIASAVALVRAGRMGRRTSACSLTAIDIRLLLYTGAAGIALQFVFFQPYSARGIHFAVALAFGAYAVVAMLGSRVCGARTLDRIVATAILLTVIGEVTLRAVAAVHPIPLLTQSDISAAQKIRAHRLSPSVVHYGFPVNSRGDYDEEPAPRKGDRPLVVSIGDSLSTGVVPHADHFTTVAERAVGADIYNLGLPAIGPFEYLVLMEAEALPMRPDVIVVNLFVGNDVEPAKSLARLFFDRGNLLVYQVPRRLLRIRGDLAAGKEPVTVAASNAQPRALSREEILRRFPWVADWSLEPPSFEPAAFLRVERERALAVCDDGREVDARYAALYSEIRRMKVTAGGIPLVFTLIPDEFQVEDALWSKIVARAGRPLEREKPQSLIGAFLTREGLPYLDLLPVLRAVPPLADGNRHLYHLRDTHLNVRGNRVMGERLAEFLRAYLPGVRGGGAGRS